MSKTLASTNSLVVFFFLILFVGAEAKLFGGEVKSTVVKSEEREVLADNEYGRITAVNISDGNRGLYHMRFFTLEPNSLLLPLLLHADMVFYVNTGSGRLSWANEKESKTVNLKRGDIYRLQTGSLFFVQSDLETERQSLRLYALFSNTDYDVFEPQVGAYSSVRDLVRGFDKATLKQAFQVSDEVIESITSASETEPIVHALSKKKDDEKDKKKKKEKKKDSWAMEARFLKAFSGFGGYEEMVNKKQKGSKGETYNVFEESPDFENCNGWSLTVSPKRAERMLGESNIGVFMVNLTKGSMMGPHWNPKATEVAVVLHGQGMVRVVCASRAKKTGSECKNMRIMVKEGDAFVIPRFHPMAQLSFNNDSFVFMGFSTTRRENHPQFLAGRQSVLNILDRDILALTFNVPNTTIDQILAPQSDAVILECTSCAEEEERKMEEEKKEEEAREREKEEEERRKREEEEARKREEEEEARRREKEEARKREEKERRKREEEEEARKREEEEAREREEEERRKREEEEARKREEEEEARRREKEEAWKREEEEAWKREEEEARKREEEEARKREEEARKREEEEAREREEEEARKREEEEAREREEERERERQQEEQERREREEERERERQQEEQERRDAEEAARERERQEQQEQEQREAEEAAERERQQEEEQERARREAEEEARRQEQERRAAEEAAERARQQVEEQERARREAEEAARREEEEGGGGEAPASLKMFGMV